MRLSASQQERIVDCLDCSDPWVSTPAINSVLGILGFVDRIEFIPGDWGESDRYLWTLV